MPTWLIWLIVIVVILLIVAAIVAFMNRRRTAMRRGRAEELRTEASTHAGALPESQRQSDELRAKADLAEAEAERTREQARRAERAHEVEQASYEDKVREADRLDPDVNTRDDDYRPEAWDDEATGTSPSSPRHVASPDETTVAQRTEDPEAAGTASTVDPETGERRTTE
jgi:hypothetical protein